MQAHSFVRLALVAFHLLLTVVADRKLASINADPSQTVGFRLGGDGPAIHAGVEVPSDWPDPRRKADSGKPDIGAIPFGEMHPHVGRKPE